MRRERLRWAGLVLALLFCAAAGLWAQSSGSPGHSMDSGGHVVIKPDQIKWGPAPPGLPAGSMMAVLEGDPGKDGMFVVRAKLPAGYKIPAHWHTNDEHITVISGVFSIGSGDVLDKSAATKLGPGGYTAMAPKMHHFAFCDEETTIQIHGMGPFDIHYINPADDPRPAGSAGRQ